MYDFMYEGPGRYKTSSGQTMIVRHAYDEPAGCNPKMFLVAYLPGTDGYHRLSGDGVEQYSSKGSNILLVGRRLDDCEVNEAGPEPDRKPETRRDLPLADGVLLSDIPDEDRLWLIGDRGDVIEGKYAGWFWFEGGHLRRFFGLVDEPHFSSEASARAYLAGLNASKAGDA